MIEGIKAAGVSCPTRKAFINNLRLVKGYTADGWFPPMNFADVYNRPFFCAYYIQVVNKQFVPQFGGKQFCGKKEIVNNKILQGPPDHHGRAADDHGRTGVDHRHLVRPGDGRGSVRPRPRSLRSGMTREGDAVAPYIISGLVAGSITAISALGLLITYKSSRVFNFAHGAIAYSIAIFYYYLTTKNGWSIAVAAPFTILIVAPLLGLFLYFALFRRLTHASPTVRLVSTVGLWVALPALIRMLFPFSTEDVFQPQGLIKIPVDPNFLKVFGTYMNTNQVAVIVSAVVIMVGTSLVLRFTPIGLATRITVDHPRNAEIAGVNTEAVTAGSWMVGIMLAGFAGVLLAPIVGLTEFQFTLLLVGSFAAVVIGRMTSLPLTFVGAIAIGLLQQLWLKWQPDEGLFSVGVAASIPFAVMLVFLIVYSFTSSGLRREAFEIDRRVGGGAHGDAAPAPARARSAPADRPGDRRRSCSRCCRCCSTTSGSSTSSGSACSRRAWRWRSSSSRTRWSPAKAE